MPTLDDILTWPTAFLLLGLYVTSFAIRRLCEAIWPTLSDKTPLTRAERVWDEFVLPTLPALLGLVFCLSCPPTLFAYPEVVKATWVSRALYGLGTGWFAAWGYRVIKGVLKQKWNIPFPDDSLPPSPPPAGDELVPVVVPPNPVPRNLK